MSQNTPKIRQKRHQSPKNLTPDTPIIIRIHHKKKIEKKSHLAFPTDAKPPTLKEKYTKLTDFIDKTFSTSSSTVP